MKLTKKQLEKLLQEAEWKGYCEGRRAGEEALEKRVKYAEDKLKEMHFKYDSMKNLIQVIQNTADCAAHIMK